MALEQAEPPVAAPPTGDNQTPDVVDTNSDSSGVEEGRNEYYLGGFHPVYIGDVYGGKYEIINNGYGSYSIVWMAKDLSKA